MANIINNDISIHLKKSPASAADRVLYDSDLKKLLKFITELRDSKRFDDSFLGDFDDNYYKESLRYNIAFTTKGTELNELSKKLYDRFERIIKYMEHKYEDIDARDYGGQYLYIVGIEKKYVLDIDYFDDEDEWLEGDNEFDEPVLEKYLYFENESRVQGTINIKMKGDTEKLEKLIDHLDSNLKWDNLILFNFESQIKDGGDEFNLKFFTLNEVAEALSDKLFSYAHSTIDSLTYTFVDHDRLKAGGRFVYEGKHVKVFDLNMEYVDDFDNAEKGDTPNIEDYLELKNTIQIFE